MMLNVVCGLSIPVYTSDKQYVHVFFSYKSKSSSKICQSNKKRVENNLAFCVLQSVPYQRIVVTVQVRKKKEQLLKNNFIEINYFKKVFCM